MNVINTLSGVVSYCWQGITSAWNSLTSRIASIFRTRVAQVAPAPSQEAPTPLNRARVTECILELYSRNSDMAIARLAKAALSGRVDGEVAAISVLLPGEAMPTKAPMDYSRNFQAVRDDAFQSWCDAFYYLENLGPTHEKTEAFCRLANMTDAQLQEYLDANLDRAIEHYDSAFAVECAKAASEGAKVSLDPSTFIRLQAVAGRAAPSGSRKRPPEVKEAVVLEVPKVLAPEPAAAAVVPSEKVLDVTDPEVLKALEMAARQSAAKPGNGKALLALYNSQRTTSPVRGASV